MATLMLDTHNFVKRMIGAGMPEQQAEVLVEAQRELVESHLATKSDLELLKRDLQGEVVDIRNDMASLRRDMDSGFSALRHELEAGLSLGRHELEAGLAVGRHELEAGLSSVRRDIAESRADTIKWVAGIALGQIAVVAALVKLL